MKGVLDRHIESKINWSDINHIGVIGIDEIALKKGHKDYVTLIACRNVAPQRMKVNTGPTEPRRPLHYNLSIVL